jgi:acyl-CoA thioester hydrolase
MTLALADLARPAAAAQAARRGHACPCARAGAGRNRRRAGTGSLDRIPRVTERTILLPDVRSLGAPVFTMRLRVYYEDTDAGGIVYYANYLRYFERARTDWLRSMGAVHTELDAAHGLVFVVRDLAIDYIAPARLDDELVVGVHVLEARRASMRLAQTARRADGTGGTLVLSSVRVAALDRGTGRAVGFPRWLIDRLQPVGPQHQGTEVA